MSVVRRARTIILLIALIPIGFYTKFYLGPASEWVNNSLGGIIYVIFWSLLFFLFAPKVNPVKISFGVFIVTCLLEFLQLWHPIFLESIRMSFLGRAILGTTFSWLDQFHYLIGCIISLALLDYLSRNEKKII